MNLRGVWLVWCLWTAAAAGAQVQEWGVKVSDDRIFYEVKEFQGRIYGISPSRDLSKFMIFDLVSMDLQGQDLQVLAEGDFRSFVPGAPDLVLYSPRGLVLRWNPGTKALENWVQDSRMLDPPAAVQGHLVWAPMSGETLVTDPKGGTRTLFPDSWVFLTPSGAEGFYGWVLESNKTWTLWQGTLAGQREKILNRPFPGPVTEVPGFLVWVSEGLQAWDLQKKQVLTLTPQRPQGALLNFQGSLVFSSPDPEGFLTTFDPKTKILKTLSREPQVQPLALGAQGFYYKKATNGGAGTLGFWSQDPQRRRQLPFFPQSFNVAGWGPGHLWGDGPGGQFHRWDLKTFQSQAWGTNPPGPVMEAQGLLWSQSGLGASPWVQTSATTPGPWIPWALRPGRPAETLYPTDQGTLVFETASGPGLFLPLKGPGVPVDLESPRALARGPGILGFITQKGSQRTLWEMALPAGPLKKLTQLQDSRGLASPLAYHAGAWIFADGTTLRSWDRQKATQQDLGSVTGEVQRILSGEKGVYFTLMRTLLDGLWVCRGPGQIECLTDGEISLITVQDRWIYFNDYLERTSGSEGPAHLFRIPE